MLVLTTDRYLSSILGVNSLNLAGVCPVLPLLSGISSPSPTFSLPRHCLLPPCGPVSPSSLSHPTQDTCAYHLGLCHRLSRAHMGLATRQLNWQLASSANRLLFTFPQTLLSVSGSQQKLAFSLDTVPGTFHNRDCPSPTPSGSQGEECEESEESGLLHFLPKYAR